MNKGKKVDCLVMIVILILRILVLYLYLDLDVFIIDELLLGRKKIDIRFFEEF